MWGPINLDEAKLSDIAPDLKSAQFVIERLKSIVGAFQKHASITGIQLRKLREKAGLVSRQNQIIKFVAVHIIRNNCIDARPLCLLWQGNHIVISFSIVECN